MEHRRDNLQIGEVSHFLCARLFPNPIYLAAPFPARHIQEETALLPMMHVITMKGGDLSAQLSSMKDSIN